MSWPEPSRELQEWLGHADYRTTTRYLHYRARGDEARRLSAAFSPPSAVGALRDEVEDGAFVAGRSAAALGQLDDPDTGEGGVVGVLAAVLLEPGGEFVQGEPAGALPTDDQVEAHRSSVDPLPSGLQPDCNQDTSAGVLQRSAA